MAREWLLRGVNEEELWPRPKTEPPKTPKGWFENFWYHYKWHTIAVLAAAVVLSVLIAQIIRRDDPDYFIIFATEGYVPPSAAQKIEAELEKYGRDIDGDGKVEVQFDLISLSAGDYQMGSANRMKFAAHLSAFDSVFFIIDKPTYQKMIAVHEEGDFKFFAPIGAEVEGLEGDGRYWNWKNSELRKAAELELLPEDLYFGIRSISDTASKKVRDMHNQSIELIQAFLTRKPLKTGSTTVG
ncbi:MAG TPA: hypothetical protein PKX71_06535 [Candidatus Avimonas sp.]|jgi:hypothetical protein|nr:hypothetical protein [Clostridiales bacterium]HOB37208.1 hypothetical protein [Candidatus Avimonas sp.]HQA16598.1 hypothetical protein [Candidatus Avimonas sp.]HQD38673.1 hypothetical protein [Candidatus Avimonas sp.]